MKKVLVRIILITLIIAIGISTIYVVDAAGAGASALIKGTFNGSSNPKGNKVIVNVVSAVLGIVRTIGATVAVVILMTIGAKYIIASAGDRADLKKYAVNYIIGAVILLAASSILTIIRDFVLESLK